MIHTTYCRYLGLEPGSSPETIENLKIPHTLPSLSIIFHLDICMDIDHRLGPLVLFVPQVALPVSDTKREGMLLAGAGHLTSHLPLLLSGQHLPSPFHPIMPYSLSPLSIHYN
ncbi:hypothetical protein J6590_004909 [Homalodisca vitripennis]|nr:hypothetical protein J6590_004909 [Homalodisca vitripennis]